MGCGAVRCGATQSDWGFFWYGLNIEDPELNKPSLLEAAGIQQADAPDAARDRSA